MILIIKICKDSLHDPEFVKPIEDVLKRNNIDFNTVHYREITEDSFENIDRIIISGTSLKDNKFLEDLEFFNWIKECKKPILGICGGMHILGLMFNGELMKISEIGLTDVFIEKKYLEIQGKKQEYDLHNFFVKSDDFEVFGTSKSCAQATKHKQKPFYGVLFHPEVRSKDLIVNFTKL